MARRCAIGIDLGGTNVKGVLIREDGEILRQEQEPVKVNDSKGEATIQDWKKCVFHMVAHLNEEANADAIGLAAPGLPNSVNDRISFMPGKLPGLEDFHWGEFLELKRVSVLNDAQAALVAECEFGKGKGIKNAIMITLGTGVGGGIVIDGVLYQGMGQRAGHVGHIGIDSIMSRNITGIPGSLENAIGDSTVKERSFGKYNSTLEVVEGYKKGHPLAAYVWLESVRKLAIGIASICNIVSPEIVILGGGIALAGNAFFDPLKEFLGIYDWQPGGLQTPVEKAVLNEFAGAVGAAVFALRES